MLTEGSREAFLQRADAISGIMKDHLQSSSSFMVISHHDADGLSSAGIMGSALARANAKFNLRIVEELREDIVAEISAGKPDIVIFTDIGSGYLELLSTNLEAKAALILDHHPPNPGKFERISQLNPHEFKIDGATLVSAAGVCYLVARSLRPKQRPKRTRNRRCSR